jgi:formylglycine-generating enzyme required for sulfatase activity
LFDLLGNVWEWTGNCWHDNYQGAPPDGSAWKGAIDGDCNHRVIRDDSWINGSQSLRSADRNGVITDVTLNYLGFCIARAL